MDDALPTATIGRRVPLGAGYRQGMLHTFGPRDGLPHAIINCLFVDSKQRLWIGTFGGLCRIEGHDLVVFTTEDGLPHNCVYALAQDAAGDLWIGCEDGLCRFDGVQFHQFEPGDRLASRRVGSLLICQNGDLWVGGGGFTKSSPVGLARFAQDELTQFTVEDGLPHGQIWSLYETQGQQVWVGTADGAARFGDGRFHAGDPDGATRGKLVRSFYEDRQHRLWACTSEGLCRYDDGHFLLVSRPEDPLAANIHAVYQDQQGELWSGTWAGVRRSPDLCEAIDVQRGLANNVVMDLQEDHLGDLWIATLSGLTRCSTGQHAHFTVADGVASDCVLAMVEDDDGRLWLATTAGVSCHDGRQMIDLAPMRGRIIQTLIFGDDGRLWIGGSHGLSHFDGNVCVDLVEDESWPGRPVLSSAKDKAGRVWFGTDLGLFRLEGDALSSHIPDISVLAIVPVEDGSMWIRTHDAIGHFVEAVPCEWFAASSLDVNKTPFVDDGGILWYSTAEGGVIAERGDQRRHLTAADGFTDSFVSHIMADDRGHLWFSTFGDGVLRYDGVVFQRLSRREGLIHDAVQQVLQDRQGRMWIATEGGLSRYQPLAQSPSVCVTAVVANQRHEATASARLAGPPNLVAFEISGSSHTTPVGHLIYRARLEGYESDWHMLAGSRAEFQNLPLGEYVFQVRAVDADLNESTTARVELVVEEDPRIAALHETLAGGTPSDFVGDSEPLRRVQMQLAEVAPTDATVLIEGETGTGKGLAARAVHEWSQRSSGPLVHVHCGALPESLVESELFGHERGAFTGAIARKAGKAELADGGTLFLDEIGDMPLAAQVKLLRLLEERTFERVGGTRTLTADVRIIAATNRDLSQMVRENTFREDLLYRLRVFPVRLPPLRERRSDIRLLALYFMQNMAGHIGKQMAGLSPQAGELLEQYDWPGNVRELEHAVQRAVIICAGPHIGPEQFSLHSPAGGGDRDAIHVSLEQNERQHIEAVLNHTEWVIRGDHGAARILGLHEATLRSKMKRLGIVRPGG
ncbi:MAG: sigma 54-interacting transcriptional regulator [Gemmatimonadetes bacterium]|nr:sigma 54-interacting transcriptional regulator [Gemmatimonadota bacterium]